MEELLELCGFSSGETQQELPRIKRCFEKLEITVEDIERAKERLNTYYDIELEGIRMSLRLCLREFVNAVLAREEGKKTLYGLMSTQFGWTISPALVTRSNKVYSGAIDMLFPFILGCIFGKLNYLLEAAERAWLKAGGVTHCGNVKTFAGIFITGLLPKPDLMVASGFNCETAPKTLYMLHDFYDIPVYQFGTCQDRESGEPADNRTAAFAERSLRRLVRKVQEVVGFEITDAMLRASMNSRKDLAVAMGKLADLVHNHDPLLLRPANDMISTVLFELPLSDDAMPEAIEAIEKTYEELQAKAESGRGVLEKGAPRIIAPLPMHQSDPRLEHLINEMGIALVPSPFSSPPPLPAIKEDEDPYVVMSGGNHPPMDSTLRAKIPALAGACHKMNIDGLLNRFHVGCRMMTGEAILNKEAVEKTAAIPVLLLDWDSFDPRIFNHERYRRRLEVFKTMMLARKGTL
jgi:benzoyl-CoA reductase/2-hydroxyglutaryl-CoA dehydratase subunit BcrC/BadD/HgdB